VFIVLLIIIELKNEFLGKGEARKSAIVYCSLEANKPNTRMEYTYGYRGIKYKVMRLQGMPGRDTLFVHYRFRI
jgi:hypothetical protein